MQIQVSNLLNNNPVSTQETKEKHIESYIEEYVPSKLKTEFQPILMEVLKQSQIFIYFLKQFINKSYKLFM